MHSSETIKSPDPYSIQLHEGEAQKSRHRTWRRRLLWPTLAGAVALVGPAGFFASREPELFDPMEAALQRAPADTEVLPPGAVLTAAVIEIGNTLKTKTGGFLSNDWLPPFALLDNMPSWEYGVLTELRDTVRAMRNDFGRAQSQSVEDPDLVIADAQFHFSPESWMLPSSEEEYRAGIAALERYFDRLLDQNPTNGRFFVRTDNLNFYLATVEKRLGNLSQRLSASANLPYLLERPASGAEEDALQPGGTAAAHLLPRR